MRTVTEGGLPFLNGLFYIALIVAVFGSTFLHVAQKSDEFGVLRTASIATQHS